jgi:hypothetical protein
MINTERELFDAFLIESNKEESAAMHLDEFLYYGNKSISNLYDSLFFAYPRNQKVRDYLKAIKRTVEISDFESSLKGFTFDLPEDYRHLQRVEVFYKVNKPYDKCINKDKIYSFTCKVLEPDQQGSVQNDFFYSPGYRRVFSYNTPYYSLIQNKCELLLGQGVGLTEDDDLQLVKIQLDYLKKPNRLTLTYYQAFEEQDDNSTLLEFDEITNKKILDELVKLVFERNNDPRVQGHIQVNTINPLQDTLQEVQ